MNLTPRQNEAVMLMCDGSLDKHTAIALFITPSTVAKRIQSAMVKYGVESRTELAFKVGVEVGKARRE